MEMMQWVIMLGLCQTLVEVQSAPGTKPVVAPGTSCYSGNDNSVCSSHFGSF